MFWVGASTKSLEPEANDGAKSLAIMANDVTLLLSSWAVPVVIQYQPLVQCLLFITRDQIFFVIRIFHTITANFKRICKKQCFEGTLICESIFDSSGATDHHWSVIRSDQYLRFGTHVIQGLIYEKKKKLCACSVHSARSWRAEERRSLNARVI